MRKDNRSCLFIGGHFLLSFIILILLHIFKFLNIVTYLLNMTVTDKPKIFNKLKVFD